MKHHILEADSIQLTFGHRKILSDIYLKCETGRITGLLGANGQGKSSLMKIIYGTLDHEKSVRVDHVAQHKTHKQPGLFRYLPQFNFIPKLRSLKKIFEDFELDYSSFEQTFPMFGAKYKDVVSSLSGGEQRIIEVYVIVKSATYFAMLDEPFSHLSPIQIEKIKELLLEEKENKGILVTDHMYRHVIDICDQIYVLKNGTTYSTKNTEDIERLGYVNF